MNDTEVTAEQLKLEISDGVAVLTLNNPSRANALSNETFGVTLPKWLADLDENDGVRVVVLTGAGTSFCAGTELDADGFSSRSEKEKTKELLHRAHQSITTLRSFSKPTVAAVGGAAVGAGLGLALACDLRIGSGRARFSGPYVRMGLTPDMGVSYLLTETIGISATLEMLLTGDAIGAVDALRLGLISRIVEDALDSSVELARSIASAPSAAVSATRSLVFDARDHGLEWALADGEPSLFAEALGGEEFQEIFSAYQAKLASERKSKSDK